MKKLIARLTGKRPANQPAKATPDRRDAPPFSATVVARVDITLPGRGVVAPRHTPGRVVADVSGIAGPDGVLVDWRGFGVIATPIADLQPFTPVAAPPRPRARQEAPKTTHRTTTTIITEEPM